MGSPLINDGRIALELDAATAQQGGQRIENLIPQQLELVDLRAVALGFHSIYYWKGKRKLSVLPPVRIHRSVIQPRDIFLSPDYVFPVGDCNGNCFGYDYLKIAFIYNIPGQTEIFEQSFNEFGGGHFYSPLAALDLCMRSSRPVASLAALAMTVFAASAGSAAPFTFILKTGATFGTGSGFGVTAER